MVTLYRGLGFKRVNLHITQVKIGSKKERKNPRAGTFDYWSTYFECDLYLHLVAMVK